MLSDTQRATIAATLPAVEGSLAEITPLFYRGLFAAHPDLLDNLFNRTHQKSGEQPQALAGSIAAFARLVMPCLILPKMPIANPCRVRTCDTAVGTDRR